MKVKETQLCDLLPRISIALVHSNEKARCYLGKYGVDAELGSQGARTVSFSNGCETKNLVIMHDRGGSTLFSHTRPSMSRSGTSRISERRIRARSCGPTPCRP